MTILDKIQQLKNNLFVKKSKRKARHHKTKSLCNVIGDEWNQIIKSCANLMCFEFAGVGLFVFLFEWTFVSLLFLLHFFVRLACFHRLHSLLSDLLFYHCACCMRLTFFILLCTIKYYSVYRFLSSSMLLSKIFFSPSLNITAQRTWNDNALPVLLLLSNCSSCCMVVGYCCSICCSPSVREAVTNASFSLLTSLLFFITSCRCSVSISCIGSRRCMRRAVRRCGGSCCSCSSKGRSFCMPCCWSSSSFAG